MCCKMINSTGKVSDGVDFNRKKKSSLSVCHGGGGVVHGWEDRSRNREQDLWIERAPYGWEKAVWIGNKIVFHDEVSFNRSYKSLAGECIEGCRNGRLEMILSLQERKIDETIPQQTREKWMNNSSTQEKLQRPMKGRALTEVTALS